MSARDPGPPRVVRALLGRVLPAESRREILADLDDQWRERAVADGALTAAAAGEAGGRPGRDDCDGDTREPSSFIYWYTRAFPIGVQDRVIRLEERLRMERLLPADLKPRIGDFSTDQLIALRFASDAELPDLARRVLEEDMTDRDAIKRAVKGWRPDHQRI